MLNVTLRDLKIHCCLGVYPGERTTTQDLLVHLSLTFLKNIGGISDRIEDTSDYAQIYKEITFLLEHARFRLLESAAEVIARHLFIRSEPLGLQKLQIEIEKPQALWGQATPIITLEHTLEFMQEIKKTSEIWSSQHTSVQSILVAPNQTVTLEADHRQTSCYFAPLHAKRPVPGVVEILPPKTQMHFSNTKTQTQVLIGVLTSV